MFMILITIIIALAIVQYIKKCTFFSKRGIKSPFPIPYLGMSFDFYFIGKNIRKFNLYMREKYGKIYGFYIGSVPVIVIGDEKMARIITQKEAKNFSDTQILKDLNIKYIKDSFIMKKGKEWKDKRALVSPVFTTKRIKDIYPSIQKATIPLFENIENLIKQGKGDEIEIKDLLQGYSLDVIAKYVFALELNSAKDKDHPFVKAVKKFINFTNSPKFLLITLLPLKIVKALDIQLLDVKSTDYVASLVRHLIKERENGGENYNDFLSMYLDTIREKNLPINEDEIIGVCIIFFFGALDTVSTSICNVLYSLILNPECQEKLYNELIDLFPNKEMDYDNLKTSPYLEACIKESQRLYPVLTMTFRIAEEAMEIENFKIEAKDNFAIDIMSFHTSPEYWSEPDKFKPERFLDNKKFNFDNVIDSESMLFLPFGSGPRSCLATRYALLQLKYTIARIILNYQVYRTEKTTVPPNYIKVPNQLIYKDMYLGFRKREN